MQLWLITAARVIFSKLGGVASHNPYKVRQGVTHTRHEYDGTWQARGVSRLAIHAMGVVVTHVTNWCGALTAL